jgi:hypothetical protein
MKTTAIASAGFLPPGVEAYMTYNNQSGYYSLFGTQNLFHSTNTLNVQLFLKKQHIQQYQW